MPRHYMATFVRHPPGSSSSICLPLAPCSPPSGPWASSWAPATLASCCSSALGSGCSPPTRCTCLARPGSAGGRPLLLHGPCSIQCVVPCTSPLCWRGRQLHCCRDSFPSKPCAPQQFTSHPMHPGSHAGWTSYMTWRLGTCTWPAPCSMPASLALSQVRTAACRRGAMYGAGIRQVGKRQLLQDYSASAPDRHPSIALESPSHTYPGLCAPLLAVQWRCQRARPPTLRAAPTQLPRCKWSTSQRATAP